MQEQPNLTIERRFVAMGLHVICFLFGPSLWPLIVPLFVWLYCRDKSEEFIGQHAKEVFNFGVSMTLYLLVAVGGFLLLRFLVAVGEDLFYGYPPHFEVEPLLRILRPLLSFLSLSSFVLLIAVVAVSIYFGIRAARAAYRGQPCHYPLKIRFIK